MRRIGGDAINADTRIAHHAVTEQGGKHSPFDVEALAAAAVIEDKTDAAAFFRSAGLLATVTDILVPPVGSNDGDAPPKAIEWRRGGECARHLRQRAQKETKRATKIASRPLN